MNLQKLPSESKQDKNNPPSMNRRIMQDVCIVSSLMVSELCGVRSPDIAARKAGKILLQEVISTGKVGHVECRKGSKFCHCRRAYWNQQVNFACQIWSAWLDFTNNYSHFTNSGRSRGFLGGICSLPQDHAAVFRSATASLGLVWVDMETLIWKILMRCLWCPRY